MKIITRLAMVCLALCLARCASRAQKVEYKIYREWEIPNGGYGRVILIDSATRNMDGLKKLGETLRHDTKHDRNAFVFVFDDVGAAALRDNEPNLTDDERTFYEKHFVGSYLRNANTGFHQLNIFLNGLAGTVVKVTY